MPIYEFTLVVEGLTIDDPHHDTRLSSAGASDAIVYQSDGATYAAFTRETASASEAVSEAVRSAVEAIHRADPAGQILGLDQDLVSASDIAERIGVTRQAIGHYVAGTRGPGGFPRPDGVIGNGQRIWRWARVHEWLREADGIDVRFEDDAWPIPADLAVTLQAELQGLRHQHAGA